MAENTTTSLNARAARLADGMVADQDLLRVAVGRGAAGERVIDAGAKGLGSLEAGLRIARIALGGLAEVATGPVAAMAFPLCVTVRTPQPVLACLGSQYAGWPLSHDGYAALGSGPARALFAHEKLFRELAFKDRASLATLIVEGESAPPKAVAEDVAARCGIAPEDLTFILVPTRSLAGCVQVAARALENAISKARKSGFDLGDLVEGLSVAPLAPPHPDQRRSMARTNDGLIYGSRVQLFVTGKAASAEQLALMLPSHTSADYGKDFAEVMRAAGDDLSKVDTKLMAPAFVSVTALESGVTYHSGAIDSARVERAFGG